MGFEAALDVCGIACIEGAIGTLNHIHVGLAILFYHRLGLTLSLFSKVNLKDFVGIVAIFLMHKERRKDFQAIC